jgi:HAD superfamily hydrolase (TIGR01549 family)
MPTQRFPPLKIVFFDFGFTLWDEQRAWNHWAEWLGVPPLEFFAVLGSVIERDEHHHRAFEIFRPGIDLAEQRRLRSEAGQSDAFRPEDLYPDALPCLLKLRAAGYCTGVAGNHFAAFADTLRRMNAPLDFIGSSEEWGVQKPSPEFFAQIVRISGVAAAEIAYVGDRLDNDVLPAKAAGMVGVFLCRGPWGRIHSLRPETVAADIRIDSLAELPGTLTELQAGRDSAG